MDNSKAGRISIYSIKKSLNMRKEGRLAKQEYSFYSLLRKISGEMLCLGYLEILSAAELAERHLCPFLGKVLS